MQGRTRGKLTTNNIPNLPPTRKQPLKNSTTPFPPITNKAKQTQSQFNRSSQKIKHEGVKKQEASRRSTSQSKNVPVKGKGKVRTGGTGWGAIPLNLLLSVAEYCCGTSWEVYRLSLVCGMWRGMMECENGVFFWKRFGKLSEARNFEEFKRCLQFQLQSLKEKRSVEFEQLFTRLFNYGSTKENLANKLIARLKLEMDVTINGRKLPGYNFKLRQFNFSSYLYSKVTELAEVPFDMYTPHNMFKDDLAITVRFYSRSFKVSHTLEYRFRPSEIGELAVKQKAFNYFLAKNLILTFFEGDNSFLYCFFEISLLELICEFRTALHKQHQQHIENHNKKVPLHKKLATSEFGDFKEYIRFQADFELHISYHNSKQQIFTHCDTKVYPIEYDQKQAYFDVPIQDTFPKTSTFLLDNKIGMSQKVDNLFLLDFVLKDRDRFIIVFSGFIYAREATQKERQSVEDYFNYAELPIKMLEYRTKKYDFRIMVVEEKAKNLIKFARFTIYP